MKRGIRSGRQCLAPPRGPAGTAAPRRRCCSRWEDLRAVGRADAGGKLFFGKRSVYALIQIGMVLSMILGALFGGMFGWHGKM